MLAKATVEEIVGQPIQYAAVVDFSGLTKVVDALGGVEVEVENSFVDEKYPVTGHENDLCGGDKTLSCRYETVSFEKGTQLMDGDTALKFVRSRNAEGDEGTDFARAARQQKVIEAIEKKIMSKETLLSFKKIKELLGLFDEVVETDMLENARVILARKLLDNRGNRHSYVLEDLLENPPVSSIYDNLYVFIPKGGNWDIVHAWIESLLPGD